MAPSKDERSNVDWASPRSKRSSTNDPAEHTKGEVQWANDDGACTAQQAAGSDEVARQQGRPGGRLACLTGQRPDSSSR